MICPACNCPIEPTGLQVELGEDDRAWRAGTFSPTISLPCQQAEAAAVIASKGAGFASIEQILIGFYGPKWLDADSQHAQRVVSLLREKLAKLGLDIINSRMLGYSIRIRNGCDCTLPKMRKQKASAPQEKKWTDKRLRTIARGRVHGKSQTAIGVELGVSPNAISGAISRNRKRIAELQAHETRQSMGGRS